MRTSVQIRLDGPSPVYQRPEIPYQKCLQACCKSIWQEECRPDDYISSSFLGVAVVAHQCLCDSIHVCDGAKTSSKKHANDGEPEEKMILESNGKCDLPLLRRLSKKPPYQEDLGN